MYFSLFLVVNLLAVIGGTNVNRRHKRYLVYPDGGPARAQFIIGLGVPVDLKDQAVTVGCVIKFQYDLPTNSTEYTSRIYGFVNTVSRDMNGDIQSKDDQIDESNAVENDGRHIDTEDDASTENNSTNIFNKNSYITSAEDDDPEDNNALVDITFDKDRRKRALVYSEGGIVNTNDLQIPTEVPLEEAIRRQEVIDQKFKEAEEEEEAPKRANRWDLYKVIEHMAERYGYSGRPCLLRTICEAAEVPFTHENGLLGEIGHILFTPSTTKDALSHHTDNEYHAAERLGRETREAGFSCETLFPECEGSVLDTFTEIGMDTLHKFGLF